MAVEHDPIGIRWPISNDALAKMDREQLTEVLAEAKTNYESSTTKILSFVSKFGGTYESVVKGDLMSSIVAAEWYRVVTIHAATFNALNRAPSDPLAD